MSRLILLICNSRTSLLCCEHNPHGVVSSTLGKKDVIIERKIRSRVEKINLVEDYNRNKGG